MSSSNNSNETEVSFEDQQKINKFARCNTRCNDIKEDLKNKKNDLTNIQDAEDEMMISLEADDKVPYMYGELFILKSQDDATESFNKDREELNEEIKDLSAKAAALEATMNEIRPQLYAKFGDNIKLEDDPE